MQRLERTLEFMSRLQQANSAEEIGSELLALSTNHGLTNLIAGTLPQPGLRPTEQKQNILLVDWPEAWFRRFVAQIYAYVDPVLNQVRKTPWASFRWENAKAPKGREEQARHMMGEAAEHGLKEGIAIPVFTLDGDPATISFGGERMDLSPAEAGFLHLAGVIAIGRAFQLQDRGRIEHSKLTQRELDIVKWCAEGKTEPEIAIILGISTATVANHIASARSKFGGINKTGLVANAIRAGLIK
ncbi:MAG: autoinducer binding domain-containing protein [Hyphomicrobiaceae bacterium]|nr:autoinducer binding domain-containing protein [Hyphomicrobiaceae bacterium]